ncbi:uncharacterized protein LOC134670603 [Cydia fagiglandana]|uniref:uncharacterized protein LOC134670603 n=1 Tax=Cydia fagiglandana TaxID=1458189 RepID=UPI002FEE36EE
MEKCEFPLTSKEIKQLICAYIQRNGLITRFKDDYPGKEWFRGFKRRHRLSVKKPQSVEVARKKACNPFTVNNYFDLLERITKELELEDKPQHIYNLDETSFCNDPTKTKVVGLKGYPSTRTTASPGRNNTTVLLASNALGKKIPPLIVFQGKQLGSNCFFENENVNTAYVGSRKGWMETKIFENYIAKVFIPAIGPERPVLLIFDGHSTHVDLSVIELLMANQITVLKLPAHSSHILQPLDCSTMKPMKDNWDSELVKWQRLHVGAKLPKPEFARIITKIWNDLNPVIIQNGFRKSGIYPLNRDTIPKEKFDKLSWSKWEEHIRQQNEQSHSVANNNAEEGRKVENGTQEDKSQDRNEVPTLTSMCTSMWLEILNRGKKEIDLPKRVKDPKTFLISLSKNTNSNITNSGSGNVKILSNIELTSTSYQKQKDEHVSFEELLLETISRSDIPKTSRKRVSQEAEILTYKEAIDRMKKKKDEKEKAEEIKRLNKLKRVNNKKKNEKKKQKKLIDKKSKSKKRKNLESDSESDCSYTPMDDSDDEDLATFAQRLLCDESFDEDLQEPLLSTTNENLEKKPKLKSERVNKRRKQISGEKDVNINKEVNFTKKLSTLEDACEEELQEPLQSTSKEEEKDTRKMKKERVNKRTNNNRMVESLRGKEKEVNFTKKRSTLNDACEVELQEPLQSTSKEEEKDTRKMKKERVNKRTNNNRMVESLRGKEKEVNFTKKRSTLNDACEVELQEPLQSTSKEEKDMLKMKEERVTKRSINNRMVESLRGKENDMPNSSEVNNDLNEGDFILAAFQSIKGKRTYKYVCLIDQINQEKMVVKGLKSYKNNREFRLVEDDISIIEKKDVISRLPKPVLNEQRDTVIFPYKVDI